MHKRYMLKTEKRFKMIYIATHKSFSVPKYNGYMPLQVGAEGKEDLGYLKDNVGENISQKNKNYCELTGVYWIWKNTNDEIKGLVHYRRYFNCSFKKSNIISDNAVKKILKKYDVILPFEMKLSTTVLDNYTEKCGFQKDVQLVREIIINKYPEYLKTYDDLWKDNKLRLFNMIIANKDIFDDYTNWLFDILFELEKKTDLSNYNDYQKRIYGFMSERLLNVYFRKNNIKVFECGVVPTEITWNLRKKLLTGLKRKYYYLKQMI